MCQTEFSSLSLEPSEIAVVTPPPSSATEMDIQRREASDPTSKSKSISEPGLSAGVLVPVSIFLSKYFLILSLLVSFQGGFSPSPPSLLLAQHWEVEAEIRSWLSLASQQVWGQPDVG